MTPIHKHCVVLVCNEGFLKPALFVCQQLASANACRFDAVIVSGEDLKYLIPENVKFLHVEMDSFTDQLPQSIRLRNFAYWRIPAIEALSPHYERILYLDADVFVNDPDQIDRLLNIDMGDQAIAAVRDVHQLTRPARIAQEHQALGLPTTPYFNSGVLLVQSSKWQAQHFFEKMSRIAKTHKDKLFCHDQSLLNLSSEGRWLELAPVWNWQYSRKNCLLTEMVSPCIIHFAGAVKLWHAPDGDIPQHYWQAYQHYLHSKGIESDLNYPVVNNASLQKWAITLTKNWWYFHHYKRYLLRFETLTSTTPHHKRFDLPI